MTENIGWSSRAPLFGSQNLLSSSAICNSSPRGSDAFSCPHGHYSLTRHTCMDAGRTLGHMKNKSTTFIKGKKVLDSAYQMWLAVKAHPEICTFSHKMSL